MVAFLLSKGVDAEYEGVSERAYVCKYMYLLLGGGAFLYVAMRM